MNKRRTFFFIFIKEKTSYQFILKGLKHGLLHGQKHFFTIKQIFLYMRNYD